MNNVGAGNRKDVPVLGTFSSAQFIKPYLAWLERRNDATTLEIGGRRLGVAEIRNALRTAVNNVHEDLIVREHRVDGASADRCKRASGGVCPVRQPDRRG